MIYVYKYFKYAILCFVSDFRFDVLWYALRYAFPALMLYRNSNHNPIIDGKPWMSFPVIEELEKILKNNQIVFEYGSGGSTLFFSKRVKRVFSIEHSKKWFDLVKVEIENRGLDNIDYKVIPPSPCLEYSRDVVSEANAYISDDEASIGMHYEDYVKEIENFPDHYFDLVVIDGRARPSCIDHAKNKVKNGGVILLDQSERKHYFASINKLMATGDWKKKSIAGPLIYNLHFTEATFFFKK